MQINIQEFLKEAGLEEPLYPGRKIVKPFLKPGEYKSCCVVYDWQNPDTIRITLKAGIHGDDLPKKDLAKYPLYLQTTNMIEIAVQR